MALKLISLMVVAIFTMYLLQNIPSTYGSVDIPVISIRNTTITCGTVVCPPYAIKCIVTVQTTPDLKKLLNKCQCMDYTGLVVQQQVTRSPYNGSINVLSSTTGGLFQCTNANCTNQTTPIIPTLTRSQYMGSSRINSVLSSSFTSDLSFANFTVPLYMLGDDDLDVNNFIQPNPQAKLTKHYYPVNEGFSNIYPIEKTEIPTVNGQIPSNIVLPTAVPEFLPPNINGPGGANIDPATLAKFMEYLNQNQKNSKRNKRVTTESGSGYNEMVSQQTNSVNSDDVMNNLFGILGKHKKTPTPRRGHKTNGHGDRSYQNDNQNNNNRNNNYYFLNDQIGSQHFPAEENIYTEPFRVPRYPSKEHMYATPEYMPSSFSTVNGNSQPEPKPVYNVPSEESYPEPKPKTHTDYGSSSTHNYYN